MVTLWAIVGLVLILSEFIVPEFVVFFFGVGALINSALVAISPRIAASIPAQLALWVATSSIALMTLRRYAARTFRGVRFTPDEDAREFEGHTAEAVEEINDDQPGRVRYGGTTWRAIAYGERIGAGDTVTIIKKEGLSLVVTGGDLLRESLSGGDDTFPDD